jgi:hypothetical protein
MKKTPEDILRDLSLYGVDDYALGYTLLPPSIVRSLVNQYKDSADPFLAARAKEMLNALEKPETPSRKFIFGDEKGENKK